MSFIGFGLICGHVSQLAYGGYKDLTTEDKEKAKTKSNKQKFDIEYRDWR